MSGTTIGASSADDLGNYNTFGAVTVGGLAISGKEETKEQMIKMGAIALSVIVVVWAIKKRKRKK